MPGERVLVVDHSAAIQDISKSVLEDHGFRVTIASNGLAAVAHPEIEKYDLIMVDSSLEGIDGLETTRQVKTDRETHKIPVLLLIPEDSIDLLESVPLKGATGWLSKPFTPAKLITKVKEVIEEQRIRVKSEQYLNEAAEAHMQQLAENKIQAAVEKKIQIIVERAIQSIVSIIDQRARREVENRVTALTAEKEQELVKMTVQEVAKSMVEKLAERKVTEAMSNILVEQTEKTVKRAAEGMLPGMVRERLREQIENTLPREIEARVTKAAEERAAEIGENIVQIIQDQSKKIVPLVAKESLPELAERQMRVVAETKMPKIVEDTARGAVARELNTAVRPLVDAETNDLRKKIGARFVVLVVFNLVVVVALAIAGLLMIKQGKDKMNSGASAPRQTAAPATATPAR